MAQTEVRQGGADYNRILHKKKGLFHLREAKPGRRALQAAEKRYNLRPFHIASIEPAGIVPPSS
jgi:hypothetical protein